MVDPEKSLASDRQFVDLTKEQRDKAKQVEVAADKAEAAHVLAMDGIRIATLITLAVHTVGMVVIAVFLVTSAQDQRETNECYQRQIVALTEWAATASEAARSDRQAQRELLLASATPDGGRAALDRYLARLDQADASRSTAPVPAQRCDR